MSSASASGGSISKPTDAPGSASAYPGSRKRKNRYCYSDVSKAGLIEITPISVEDFKVRLESVPEVSRVVFHPKGSKTAQGNPGSHYQEHNYFVYAKDFPKDPMEFELTHHDHLKTKDVNGKWRSITAMFKDTPEELHFAAWRILSQAVLDIALMPGWLQVCVDKAASRVFGKDTTQRENEESKKIKMVRFQEESEAGRWMASPGSASEESEVPDAKMLGTSSPDSTIRHSVATSTIEPVADDFVPDWSNSDDIIMDEGFTKVAEEVVSSESVAANAWRKENDDILKRVAEEAGMEPLPQAALPEHHRFPSFLQAVEVLGDPAEVREMQALKERELEHIRWRSTANFPTDVASLATFVAMKAAVREKFHKHAFNMRLDHLLSTESSGTFAECKSFLDKAHRESLAITNVKKNDGLLRDYEVLLSCLPETVIRKFGILGTSSPQEKAECLAKLINKYSGEVVEALPLQASGGSMMLPEHASWILTCLPGSASTRKFWFNHPQFYVKPGGEEVEDPDDIDFGRPISKDVFLAMENEMNIVSEKENIELGKLQPDWKAQWNRVLVPCVDAQALPGNVHYEWRRSGIVTTLGQLFMELGRKYTAFAIYEYYKRLRLVSVKRCKQAAMLGALRLRREIRPMQDTLLQEFVAITKAELPVSGSDKRLMMDKAMRYIYATILQDLRPPWLTDMFPLCFHNTPTLAAYVRPCFLAWSAEDISQTFGHKIMDYMISVVDAVNKDFAGIVARPLYACAAKLESGRVCGNICAMHPLLEFPGERQHWVCSGCRDAPLVSACGKQRMLRMLPLVRTPDKHVTPMRVKSHIALLRIPPAAFDWGAHAQSQSAKTEVLEHSARPIFNKKEKSVVWEFSESESDAIWLAARSYKGYVFVE
jgi:hypothetical protein